MMDDMEERVSRQAAAVNAQLVVAVACFAGDVAAPSELVAALPADCGAAFIFVQQRSTRREFRRKRSRLPAAASADTQSEDSARGRVDERVWRPNVASSVGEVKSVSNDMQVK
jgi:hypothetical protein